MYAKELRPPSRKPHVTPPQNYSGTAFPEKNLTPPVTADSPSIPPTDTVLPLLPSPPTAESEQEKQPPSKPDSDETAEASARPVPPPRHKPPHGFLSSLIPPGFSNSSDSDPGFEELLLVGLIFLLSRGEQDSDILLMLALLLLYR